MDQQDLSDLRRELRADRAVRAAISRLWPVLDAAAAGRRAAVRPGAAGRGRAAHAGRGPRGAAPRAADAPWTPADVPLLDEAAELLGEDDRAIRAAEAARRRRQEEAYAQGVLDIIGRDDEDDPRS